MMLAAATGLLTACQDLDEVKIYEPSKVVSPVLDILPAEIVITADNMGTTQLFTWDAANFGINTQVNYAIEAKYNGETIELFSGLTGTSFEPTYDDINTKLALSLKEGGLGVPIGEATDIEFFISATIGTNYQKYYSEPIPVKVTVTNAERSYPTVWVIGDYCSWNHGNSQFLFSFLDDEVNYEGMVDFGDKAVNGFKLTGIAGWDDSCNWGTDGDAPAPDDEAASITLISSGGSGNISAYSKRFYHFTFDRSTLVLTKDLSFDQLGVIGDFNGWGGDVVMEFDAAKQRFWADVDFPADGGFKFRADGLWDTSFGSATEGKLDSGDNISVTAGKYRVYVNLNNSANRTYELNAEDYGQGGGEDPDPVADWYIHGQTVATPEWGPTEMVSASSNIVAYKAAGVEVAANSEFLFKSGDESQWVGVDNTFAGGALYTCTIGAAFKTSGAGDKVNALIATAGTYDYWLLPDAGRAYVMTAGEKPEYVANTYGLVGNLTGWGDLGDFAMTDNGTYLVRMGVAITTENEFKIRYNNEWVDTNNYGTAAGGVVDINKAIDLINGSGSQNMKIQLDGTYDVYFDLANTKLYIMTAGSTPADAE